MALEIAYWPDSEERRADQWQHTTFISSRGFQVQPETAIESQGVLLMLNIVVFFCLGLGAIRNRERLRRILRYSPGRGKLAGIGLACAIHGGV